jgi:hypothetical protein
MSCCEVLTLGFNAVFFLNNGLREAVVTTAFLFLSTFFIQSARAILNSGRKPVNTFVVNFVEPVHNSSYLTSFKYNKFG